MAWDPAKFSIGSIVQVADLNALEEFRRTWKWHHKLESEQLGFAGRVAKVVWLGCYHGGDMIYRLENVPGIWHEQCLELETSASS
jgi:hypothetical protein